MKQCMLYCVQWNSACCIVCNSRQCSGGECTGTICPSPSIRIVLILCIHAWILLCWNLVLPHCLPKISKWLCFGHFSAGDRPEHCHSEWPHFLCPLLLECYTQWLPGCIGSLFHCWVHQMSQEDWNNNRYYVMTLLINCYHSCQQPSTHYHCIYWSCGVMLFFPRPL